MCIQKKKNTFLPKQKVRIGGNDLTSEHKSQYSATAYSPQRKRQAKISTIMNTSRNNNKDSESNNNDKSKEMITEIQDIEPLFNKSVGIQYDKYAYLDIFYHNYFKDKFPEIYGIFCPIFEDFISKNHPLYLKMLVYFEILLDMTMFFEKNINPLIYTKISYWRGIETLKKTTIMIVGEKGTGKSTFANTLLKAGAKNSDIKMFSQKSINFIHYSLNENKWQCPFEKKYFELTKWGSRLGKTFTKHNTTIYYKAKNEFLDQYNIIDCSTFESKIKKIVKRNVTVTESENVTSNDSFIKQSNITSENDGNISINEMNEILFSRMDVITIMLDNKKFSPTLNNLIESVNSFGKKTLFILNHSDKAKSRKELELKKEILRWYTMDKVNSSTSVKIHCSSFAEKSRIEEVRLFVDFETKKIYQWLDFFKATTINYRVEDILKEFKNSVSQLLMLFIMSRKDKRFINKDESEYQTYINEAQKLANINNLPFNNEFIKESFTYTELPPEKKCVITMFNSDWRQLPEIEYFIEDEKHLDKIKNT